MIFTDHYHPGDEIRCFVCGEALGDWTGFDGPCLELTFHEGCADPDLPEWAEDPALDGGPILDPSVKEKRLPDYFVISSRSCGCPFPNRVQGQSREGVWMHSVLLTGGPEDRRWIGPERKEDFHRRMNWLNKRTEEGGAANSALLRGVTFCPVTIADFDELVVLRIAAMRDSLERAGRFDPERARERLRKSFHPGHTEFVVLEGQRIGFYTLRPAADGFHLDHLYIHPSHQSRGIGSHVIRHLLSQSDARRMPVHVGALRGSPSNKFYQRHGFIQTTEDEWDIYYLRTPKPD